MVAMEEDRWWEGREESRRRLCAGERSRREKDETSFQKPSKDRKSGWDPNFMKSISNSSGFVLTVSPVGQTTECIAALFLGLEMGRSALCAIARKMVLQTNRQLILGIPQILATSWSAYTLIQIYLRWTIIFYTDVELFLSLQTSQQSYRRHTNVSLQPVSVEYECKKKKNTTGEGQFFPVHSKGVKENCISKFHVDRVQEGGALQQQQCLCEVHASEQQQLSNQLPCSTQAASVSSL